MKNYLLFSFILFSIVYFPSPEKQGVKNSREQIFTTNNKTENEINNELLANVLNAGNPFITNYNLSLDVNDQIWAIVQDSDGRMLFGSKKGVIVFDGKENIQLKII